MKKLKDRGLEINHRGNTSFPRHSMDITPILQLEVTVYILQEEKTFKANWGEYAYCDCNYVNKCIKEILTEEIPK